MKKILPILFILSALLSARAGLFGGDGEAKLDPAAALKLLNDIGPALDVAATASGDSTVKSAAAKLRALRGAKDAPPPVPPDRIVPEGYRIAIESFLDGKLIDETKIVRIPKLVPVSEVSTLKSQIAPSATNTVNPVTAVASPAAGGAKPPAQPAPTGGRAILEELRK